MNLIKPSEISARILTLLDESDDWVILVSPYMKISRWYKIANKISGLKARGIRAAIYVRDDPENSLTYRDLDQLALQYEKIPHLHSKLYMNERCGIVTSMNLLLSSEINSLEIGYATETLEEYNELLAFYRRYIHRGKPLHFDAKADRQTSNMIEFMNGIREKLNRTGKKPWLCFCDNGLNISTGRNVYLVSIADGFLRISASIRLVSGTTKIGNMCSSLIVKRIGDLSAMEVVIQPGPRDGMLKLSGQAKYALESSSFPRILGADEIYLMDSIAKFIHAADDLAF